MVWNDSRKIKKGDTFVAVQGINEDGHKYIFDAIKRGCTTVVAEHGSYKVNTIIVNDTKEYIDEYVKNKIDIKLIGVTGTNGKTTTCYLIYQLLNKLGIKTSYIGTLGYIKDDITYELNNTTPGKLELYNLLKDSYDSNIEYVVMEVSSQALDQNRVDYLEFEYAIFTNLTRDHLDYHKTINNYIKSKQKLFNRVKIKSIINNDSKYSNKFKIGKFTTFGYSNSDYKIDIKDIKTNLYGKFNEYNLYGVIVLLYEMGYKLEEFTKYINELEAPPGRMEVINYNTNKIIIDYAHTPDALLNIYSTVNTFEHNKIITVIGCGGNRDKGKRPIIGDICVKNSDYTIFTNDNPRFEDEMNIVNDIVKQLDKNNYEILLNRVNAIEKGIQLLDNNDILLVLGKGHEKYQIIFDKKIPFDDKKVIIEYIR